MLASQGGMLVGDAWGGASGWIPLCPSSLSEEGPLKWNDSIRQIHRWLSIAFTLTVIVTFVALAQKDPVVWVSYLPLLPLALLWFTGMYLFVLPYAAKWRRARGTQ
jgi:hypothetical protein